MWRNYTEASTGCKSGRAEYPPERVESLTGIPRADIVALAREYATTRPAAIRLNYGVQRSERGGTAVRAIAALPALTGSWREVGGGLQLSTRQAFHFNRTGLEMPDLQHRSPLGREARIVNMTELGKALTELDQPPVKAMVVYNSNPAAIAPNQNLVLKGMRRDDLFTVVLEQFQNDTADYADILLPATTFLEHTDLYFAYGHYYLQLARPALPAPGETKSNVEVFRAAGRAHGFRRRLLPRFRRRHDPHAARFGAPLRQRHHAGATWIASIPCGCASRPKASPSCRSRRAGSARRPANASSAPRRWITSRRWNRAWDRRHCASHYPLELISAKNDDSMNSTFGNRSWAQTRDLGAASESIGCRAARHPERRPRARLQRPGQLPADRGSGRRGAAGSGFGALGALGQAAPETGHVNMLTSDRLTDIGGGPSSTVAWCK